MSSPCKVLVAMSGGVDSSVAAALLVEQGYEVIGVTMQLWDYSKNESEASCDPNAKFDTCCSLDDVADARAVAHKLKIPFYVIDYKSDFQEKVVDYFTSSYLKGLTPNPCVACNTFLKFDHLLHRAEKLGCSKIATGHYAQIGRDETGLYHLSKGVDSSKDQSYFLYSLTQERLAKTLFPLGSMTKSEVRELAHKYNLVNAKKKESMEICFIPNNDYAKFIETHAKASDVKTGFVCHEDGRILTSHDGIHKFTVGQRKGNGIATGAPLYVTRIDSESGNVFVGDEKYLFRAGFEFENFQCVYPLDESKSYEVKIRYRTPPVAGKLKFEKDGRVNFKFDEPQKSVAPGQIGVLYSGDEVAGGGFIKGALHC